MTFSKRCVFPASLFHHSFQKERRQRRSHRAHRERHRSLDQNRWRLEVLLRLQLRLFGPEGESNILFLLMGRKEGGGSEDAAASWPRENMKRWFGPGQGWAGLEESRGCRRPPCRRGDGQLTPLLGSDFTCGSPGC